jgi:tetratricopeptide (TPR) repeat protein
MARQTVGDHRGEADSLAYLGRTCAVHGQLPGALACFEQAAAIFREQGDRYGEAESLSGAGETLEALGQHQLARRHLQAALAIFEELETPEAAQVKTLLAGRPDDTATGERTPPASPSATAAGLVK